MPSQSCSAMSARLLCTWQRVRNHFASSLMLASTHFHALVFAFPLRRGYISRLCAPLWERTFSIHPPPFSGKDRFSVSLPFGGGKVGSSHPFMGGETSGLFCTRRTRGSALRVAGLTLGKSGCRALVLPGTHRHVWHASACETVVRCARGRWALAHRSLVTFATLIQRDTCCFDSTWSRPGTCGGMKPPHTEARSHA